MRFEYDQTPLQQKIVVLEQMIKQMSDPRNEMFYSNEDRIKASKELADLITLNDNEQKRFASTDSYGGSKSRSKRRRGRKLRRRTRKH